MSKPARVAAVALVLGASFTFGFIYRDLEQGRMPFSSARNFMLGVKASAPGAAPAQVFSQNYQRIKLTYRKQLVDKDLKYAAMEGLVAALGDPHSNFFAPQENEQFRDQTRANFFGVGARLGADPAGAKVGVVFEDGPAYAAGLKAGDVITVVNGKSVAGQPTDEIVSQVKGPEGTIVTLGVLRPGQKDQVVIRIRRARINVPTVEGKLLKESNLGYLRVDQFSEPTSMQFAQQLAKLEQQGIRGLIIDLRGNPGGLLDTAVEMLSTFRENAVVVKMRGRDGEERTQRTYPGMQRDYPYKIVVLMNEESASAAEIFAGCLQDYGKAIVLGERSYGKASVQNVFMQRDKAGVKLTIAKYYLPKGRFIGRKVDDDGQFLSGGLQPDIEVPLDYDAEIVLGEPDKDNQLRAAIEQFNK